LPYGANVDDGLFDSTGGICRRDPLTAASPRFRMTDW